MMARVQKKRARLPVLCACGDNSEPGEGRRAAPSNPTHTNARERRELNLVLRCTMAEKSALLAQAEAFQVSASALMREALGFVIARHRRSPLRADPDLLREIGRVGSDLTEISYWMCGAVMAGDGREIDALVVASRLVSIERRLSQIVLSAEHSSSAAPPAFVTAEGEQRS